MDERIENTRQYLIEKYGEPIDKVVDGRKYKFINIELESFDKLIKALKDVASILKVDLKEEHINAFCDFALIEVQPNVLNVATILEKHVNSWQKKGCLSKKPVIYLLNEIETFYNDKAYKPRYLMSMFVEYIKCVDVRKKEIHKYSL